MWNCKPERCPVCGCELGSQSGALMHYRRHVRRKEAVGKGTPCQKFRCLGTADTPDNWWYHGQPLDDGRIPEPEPQNRKRHQARGWAE